jgi:hypothetical protein
LPTPSQSLVGLTRRQIADFHWQKEKIRAFGQEIVEKRIQKAAAYHKSSRPSSTLAQLRLPVIDPLLCECQPFPLSLFLGCKAALNFKNCLSLTRTLGPIYDNVRRPTKALGKLSRHAPDMMSLVILVHVSRSTFWRPRLGRASVWPRASHSPTASTLVSKDFFIDLHGDSRSPWLGSTQDAGTSVWDDFRIFHYSFLN